LSFYRTERPLASYPARSYATLKLNFTTKSPHEPGHPAAHAVAPASFTRSRKGRAVPSVGIVLKTRPEFFASAPKLCYGNNVYLDESHFGCLEWAEPTEGIKPSFQRLTSPDQLEGCELPHPHRCVVRFRKNASALKHWNSSKPIPDSTGETGRLLDFRDLVMRRLAMV
jgi:hypothetical protein